MGLAAAPRCPGDVVVTPSGISNMEVTQLARILQSYLKQVHATSAYSSVLFMDSEAIPPVNGQLEECKEGGQD